MARDTRNPQIGDRNKYYEGEYSDNKLTRGEEAKGIFYSTDEGSVTIENVTNGFTKSRIYRVKLRTKDFIPDLKQDWFVEYDGNFWIVESVTQTNINDRAKKFRRQTFEYIVSLRRNE